MDTFKTVNCKVCKKEGLCRPGFGGQVEFLPRDWITHEDRTQTRTKPMTEVCSDKCLRALKEQNRKANTQRIGW